jgi:hypothetical protein
MIYLQSCRVLTANRIPARLPERCRSCAARVRQRSVYIGDQQVIQDGRPLWVYLGALPIAGNLDWSSSPLTIKMTANMRYQLPTWLAVEKTQIARRVLGPRPPVIGYLRASGKWRSSSSSRCSSSLALATRELEPIVQGKPSKSVTVAPDSDASSAPAPAWRAWLEKWMLAATRPSARYASVRVVASERTSHLSARIEAAATRAARSRSGPDLAGHASNATMRLSAFALS